MIEHHLWIYNLLIRRKICIWSIFYLNQGYLHIWTFSGDINTYSDPIEFNGHFSL